MVALPELLLFCLEGAAVVDCLEDGLETDSEDLETIADDLPELGALLTTGELFLSDTAEDAELPEFLFIPELLLVTTVEDDLP